MTFDADELPVVGRAYRLGVNPITTTLVLLGPVVLSLLALVGRSPVTVGLALVYVLAMPGSVAYFRLVDAEGRDGGHDGDNPRGGAQSGVCVVPARGRPGPRSGGGVVE